MCCAHRLVDRKDETIVPSHLVAYIAQDGKGELLHFDCREAVVRRLRGNRDQRGSQFLELRQCLLIRTQGQVTERAPFATIEGKNDGPLFQQVREHDCLALDIW